MSGKSPTERLQANAEGIARAVAILSGGGLVALPTETVYGLAARADDPQAVARIYAAKGRPNFNPLIVHVASLSAARELAHWSDPAERLAAAHWPGPLTLVLPRRRDAGIAEAVTAALPTLALRCPAHPVIHEVLERLGAPLAAPSANVSGFVSPTTAAHVLATLDGRTNAVLDAGPCGRGVESTIAAVRETGAIEILRPGPIHLGETVPRAGVEAPGQLASHYAPGKPLRLEARERREGEFLIGFGAVEGEANLSPTGDLAEAAAQLYACLHRAAASPLPRIAVAAIPAEGIGIAINDRLRRAATPVED